MLSNSHQARSYFQQQLFRLIGTCLLLICCNNSWAEDAYRDTPVLTLRAQLYIKIGDYYASRQEYERAAAAYLKAAGLPQKICHSNNSYLSLNVWSMCKNWDQPSTTCKRFVMSSRKMPAPD